METPEEIESNYYIGYLVTNASIEAVAFQIMKCYINPIASLFGFFANIMSLAILLRSGLKKSSNIILFGLALADSMCMLMTVNIAETLIYFDSAKTNPNFCYWQYDYIVAYILDMLYMAAYFIGGWGCYTNSFVPVLVTTERFAAVFWPITFSRKITKTTATVCVITAFMFWLPYCTLYLCIYTFQYVNISNILIGSSTYASFFKDFDIDSLFLLDSFVFEALSSWVPFFIVIIGCTSICIKIKITLRARREKLSSTKKVQWSMRTTRTLLVTCFVFVVTHSLYSLAFYIFQPNLGFNQNSLLCYEVMNFFYLINNSSNFFIYVLCDNKLYLIFLQIMHLDRLKPTLKRE